MSENDSFPIKPIEMRKNSLDTISKSLQIRAGNQIIIFDEAQNILNRNTEEFKANLDERRPKRKVKNKEV